MRELEKKFSGKHVVFIAQVRMVMDKAEIIEVSCLVKGVMSADDPLV